MIFKHKYEVVVKDLGKTNKVSNKALLGFMEEIASLHSATIGHGVNDVIKNGEAWILLDWKLQVLERCNYGEVVSLNTWVRDSDKFYSYRDFEVYDEKDKLIAKGTSKWVLVDIKTTHITRISDELIKKYNPEFEKNVFNEAKLERIKEPNNYQSNIIYKVNRADIDVNKHMHNLYYLDLAYEALPEDIYLNEEMNNVRINYKHELKLGDTVKCLYSYENNKHIVAVKSEDESKLYAIVELN
jgi:medium-chain acyl-[acyl-carrier-protein] hydrolase